MQGSNLGGLIIVVLSSGMMVCRGSDGNLYDQLECATHRPADENNNNDDDEEWLLVDNQSILERLPVTSSDVLLTRTRLTLSQCKELGRFPQEKVVRAIGWVPTQEDDDDDGRGTCRVYAESSSDDSNATEVQPLLLTEVPLVMEGGSSSWTSRELFYRRDQDHRRLPIESSKAAVQIGRKIAHYKWYNSLMRSIAHLVVVVILAGVMAVVLTIVVPRLGRLSPFYPLIGVRKTHLFRISPRKSSG